MSAHPLAVPPSLALLSLADSGGGLISGERATVIIGGPLSSTGLTLIVVPIVYCLFNVSIPGGLRRAGARLARSESHA